jgi:hypothetical protein
MTRSARLRKVSRGAVSTMTLAFVISALLPSAMAQAGPSQTARKPATSTDEGWPRQFASTEGNVLFYQPQLDAWDGARLQAHSAVAIERKDATQAPLYGVIWISCRTEVDKETRVVTFLDLKVEKANFPSDPANASRYMAAVQSSVASRARTIALDRLEAALAEKATKKAVKGSELKNSPPRIVFAEVPTLHIPIDGKPVFRAAGVGGLDRIINTRQLIFIEKAQNRYYLRLFDGWMTAAALEGPWQVASNPSKDLDAAMQAVVQKVQVDLLDGTNPEDAGEANQAKPPSLSKGPVPAIHVSTTPTEVIVTEGRPNFVPIEGTQLLYVENTTSNVLRSLADQNLFVLLSGRWFKGAGTDGPWTYVPGKQLPADFAQIPDESPKENVKASVPGTAQAEEALIANEIPQTATVRRSDTTLESVVYDGAPRFQPIEGTPLQYAVNAGTPVIQVDEVTYYAVADAVWFVSASPNGPWAVADSVPAVIYTIPPSSPLHYVTYVKVYNSSAEDVQIGYTPGYYGAVAEDEDDDGDADEVVYGTGYYYEPWADSWWWGWPYTWGWGYGMAWTPWCGWSWGWGGYWGWGSIGGIGWGWGPGPWGGAIAWGPRGLIGSTGNVYNRWGNRSVVSRHSAAYNRMTGNYWSRDLGASYNSRTGRISAGHKATVGNVFTGNSASAGRGVVYNPNTGNLSKVSGIKGDQGGAIKINDKVFAGRDGDVYRKGDGGWQELKMDTNWDNVAEREKRSREAVKTAERERKNRESVNSLDRESKIRDNGNKRSKDYGSFDRGKTVDRGKVQDRSPSRGSMNRGGGGFNRGGGGGMRRGGGGGRRGGRF